MSMGCLALEYRARALLGLVEPHAWWFSPSWWSWFCCRGCWVQAGGHAVPAQPGPAKRTWLMRAGSRARGGAGRDPSSHLLAGGTLCWAADLGRVERGQHLSPCPGQCWFCSTTALPCSPQSAAARDLQGTSMSFWCEQGPVPIIMSLLRSRYWSYIGVGWESAAA